jgi:uncharacterized membrane protein HdeD (DUF308 family)
LIRGVIAVILGICAFVWPQKTIDILVKLLGVYFLVDGLTGAIGSYRSGDRAMQLGPAIASLALGLALLFWSGVSAKVFLVMTGIWLLIQGAGLFLSGREIKSETGERSIVGLVGGLMALVGLVFIFWPNTGIVAVSWLLGVGALLVGAGLIYLATRLKRLRHRLAELRA